MIRPVPNIENPRPVTEAPTISHKPGARSVTGLWPLRNVHSDHDGDGVEYAVLTVSHHAARRAYFASINREEHFSGTIRVKPYDAQRVGPLIPAPASARSPFKPRSPPRCKPSATRSPEATRSSPPLHPIGG